MGVPAYSDLMLPLLQFAGDGQEHHIREAIRAIADYLQLSEEERNEVVPKGKQPVFDYRTHWANTYLKKAGLLESTGRGTFRITQRGIHVLQANPKFIDRGFLMQFPEFVEFVTPTRNDHVEETGSSKYVESELTPKELIYTVYQGLLKELREELIEFILDSSPAFFERLVVDLLLSMGYGGALEDAGHTIGRSGDGGIDGYIQQDKLGLETIYIQAKRWSDNVVGRPDVQGFVGSLIGAKAKKGVFITTSRFSKAAEEYVSGVQDYKIILIDGEQLAHLMIEHGVGVSVEATYTIKKVDRDYFDIE